MPVSMYTGYGFIPAINGLLDIAHSIDYDNTIELFVRSPGLGLDVIVHVGEVLEVGSGVGFDQVVLVAQVVNHLS